MQYTQEWVPIRETFIIPIQFLIGAFCTFQAQASTQYLLFTQIRREISDPDAYINLLTYFILKDVYL